MRLIIDNEHRKLNTIIIIIRFKCIPLGKCTNKRRNPRRILITTLSRLRVYRNGPRQYNNNNVGGWLKKKIRDIIFSKFDRNF